jgi:aromatic-amino-acid transaminase
VTGATDVLERATLFAHIPPFAGDPILALNEEFQKDPRANKINLSIGIYFDDDGRVPVLSSVRKAEAIVMARNGPKPYLPIEGAANFRLAVQHLLFGETHEAVTSGRVATIQSVGSSGGLTVGARVIKRFFPDSAVWVSDPTWDNHRAMFDGAGFSISTYPYHDSATGGVKFAELCDALRSAPQKSVVLLHACCHNPTGADLSVEQWDELIPVLRERELIPYLDLAYQGFAEGIAADAYPVRAMANAGLNFFVANSFSKSMSVYGERCGALSVVCSDANEATRMLGQMKFAVHRNYSSPPIHGGQIVATVLTDPAILSEWETELESMRSRIVQMRTVLRDALHQLRPDQDFGYLITQRGMFSYTGLSAAQVDRLRMEHGLYMMGSGRICVAGLNPSNVHAAAAAIAAVL